MRAVPFHFETHLPEIMSWALKRGQLPPTETILPKTGRIVSGHACVFLYLTDSSIGFIENLISNPESDPKRNSEAIDECVKLIQQDAVSKGVSVVISTTFIDSVCKRAKRLGFSVRTENYKFIYKGLS